MANAPHPPKRTIWIDSLDDPDYSLRHPIALSVSDGPGGVTVSWDELGESALGETEAEAVASLKSALTELYFLLDAAEPRLNAKAAEQLDLMREVVEERRELAEDAEDDSA
jgi:hypothetical protein